MFNRDTEKRTRPGCSLEARLLNAWLEGEPSLDREVFLAHAASCPVCRRRVELADALQKETATLLQNIPEITPTPAEARALRRAAREELARTPRGGRASYPALRLSFLRPAVAALAVILAAVTLILLFRPVPKEVFRGETAAVQEGMSPQGMLHETPSTFQWDPVPGAVHYMFELIDEDLNLIVRSERSMETRYEIAGDIRDGLEPGRTYIWTVIAFDENYTEIEERSAPFVLQ